MRLGSATPHSGKLPHCDDASNSNLVLLAQLQVGTEGKTGPFHARDVQMYIQRHTHTYEHICMYVCMLRYVTDKRNSVALFKGT